MNGFKIIAVLAAIIAFGLYAVGVFGFEFTMVFLACEIAITVVLWVPKEIEDDTKQ